MEQIRMVDMAFALTHLRDIKKPSKRLQAAMSKLEISLCKSIENIRVFPNLFSEPESTE
jgi:hypothetical protein